MIRTFEAGGAVASYDDDEETWTFHGGNEGRMSPPLAHALINELEKRGVKILTGAAGATLTERIALGFLMAGGGQKFLPKKDSREADKAVSGPFGREMRALLDVADDLSATELAIIGWPDFFGNRSITLTPRGEQRARDLASASNG